MEDGDGIWIRDGGGSADDSGEESDEEEGGDISADEDGMTTGSDADSEDASSDAESEVHGRISARFGVLALGDEQVDYSFPSILLYIAGSLPLEVALPAKNVAGPTDIPSSDLTSPEDSVTLWSWCTYSFVEPLFGVAMRHTLDEADVWRLSPYFQHKNMFEKYIAYQNQHPTYSLLRFLLESNILDLSLDILLELWVAVVGFVPPYALQQILSALADDTPEARRRAFTFALFTFLAHLSFAQTALFQNFHTRRSYERTRGQLFCALHYKALKRRDVSGIATKDDSSTENADLGKVVNLMQGDAYAVSQRFWDFSKIFVAPVRLVIALVFLYSVLGWSAFAGVFVVLLAYALNYPLAKYNIFVTRSSWKAKDKRMNIVNELFQNIRFLKFYGWENLWAQKVKSSRESELRWRVKNNVVNTAIAFIWTWIPSATMLSAFLCYTLFAGQRLTVSKAFTSMALFSQLQEPMTSLPAQFFGFLHAYVSMQRIQAFLDETEVPDWACSLKCSTTMQDTRVAHQICFERAIFRWYSDSESEEGRFQLGPLNFHFPLGQLTLVTGPTGSGKSALLAALLGEMRCVSGEVLLNKRGHRVAYCAQNPWLEHATIRENIVFGARHGFVEDRYNRVLRACALTRDLKVLEAGDMTEIGEKGITLSGGQRARVALARAMYSEASCILLDDPLAAVDMHTAQHLVQHCLLGTLALGRTIILVTHHVTLCLRAASYLVELSEGRVLHAGTIRELRDRGLLQSIVDTEDVTAAEEPTPASPSRTSIENEADDAPPIKEQGQKTTSTGKLIEAEARAEGRVAGRTYMTYIRSSGTLSWLLTFVLMLLIRVINVANQVFIAKWGEAYNAIGSTVYRCFWPGHLPPPDADVKPWLAVYLSISISGAFTLCAYIALGYYASLQASRSLFISMLNRLVRAPARFFDVTPIGRILNRFTTDINIVDDALQNSLRAACSGVLNFLMSFFVIIAVVPSFAPFALFIAYLYIRLAPPFVQASRDLRRLESISLSPAFAGFDELLRGLTHVRAFAMETRYQEQFYKRVDRFQGFDHVYWLVSGWLRWRYDCLGSVVVYLTTLFALWSGVSDGFAALVIVQAGVFAEASRVLVRVAAQVELDFNSVERIVEYLDVSQEAPALIYDKRPPAYWPSTSGELAVENLVVRYAADLPAVLSNLNFTIKASEKIGVVGRTGSGKSTLALSILRMVEPSEGRIVLDDIDISTIGLDDLRSRVTMVSQDVSLFSGTLRSNLDPFQEHTDEECWEVLQRCHLLPLLAKNTDTEITPSVILDIPLSQGGSLSAGERQLVALARAVLRKTSVIILDEATSQIDATLDDQIQKTIREELSSAMVITIAHRLKTIIDYDRILVLDNGKVVEFDKPRELLKNPDGTFRQMCRRSVDWPMLEAIALHTNK
ncbi:pleiotropic drug resistance ABC transporter [Gloeophyllum trabeum ATCC 11539]|uniref:Pleiotropic drug resistance ABC transporter n=1 Tax=Gloeophyllum trabeum (strain ATCC 11539 / FP-39264 / Madison 617) TaxID=670483 RepID=S7RZJ4_GLOTA|nr:pleiotropic drug resistance ABC transporter [Gloeophyllum trabeum ATCC 11539]EPQ60440.1 pleiotropic drug resistance ABC transporter [Gloeophyllum trabeum ATCC 11539]